MVTVRGGNSGHFALGRYDFELEAIFAPGQKLRTVSKKLVGDDLWHVVVDVVS